MYLLRGKHYCGQFIPIFVSSKGQFDYDSFRERENKECGWEKWMRDSVVTEVKEV